MSDPRLQYLITFLDSDASWFRPVKSLSAFIDSEVPSFSTGKFGSEYHPGNVGSGARSNTSAIEIPPEGCIEVWMQPIGWSWTNTSSSDSRDRIICHQRTTNAVPAITVNFDNGTGIIFDLNMGTNRRLTVTNQSVADGEKLHFAVSWKEAGASGLMKMYFNGSEVGSLTADLGITGSKQNGLGFGGFAHTTTHGLGGTIGNGKRWSYFKTDFSDRERPRFGMDDVLIGSR